MSINVNFSDFSSKKLQFMLLLADPREQRTQYEIAEELNVRPETLSRWKKEESFWEALWGLTLQQIEPELYEVLKMLIVKAKLGDLAATKLLFEVCGKIGPQKKCLRTHSDLAIVDNRLKEQEIREFANETPQWVKDRILKLINEIKKGSVCDLELVADEIILEESVEISLT